MNNWANIEVSPQDPEIIKINAFEKSLGELPAAVLSIRELITRFEVCHFKLKIHLKNIRDSINELHPVIDPAKIGKNHLRYGTEATNRDTSGKSKTGQDYVKALKDWIKAEAENELSNQLEEQTFQHILHWLGKRTPDKLRLVKLLLARLSWDWSSMEKLQTGGEFKDIEYQVLRMDICHYAFPGNLDQLIKAIGQMKAVDSTIFEGCGSCNAAISSFLEEEFNDLNQVLESKHDKNALTTSDSYKTWLMQCLAKTIKENINLKSPINGITN